MALAGALRRSLRTPATAPLSFLSSVFHRLSALCAVRTYPAAWNIAIDPRRSNDGRACTQQRWLTTARQRAPRRKSRAAEETLPETAAVGKTAPKEASAFHTELEEMRKSKEKIEKQLAETRVSERLFAATQRRPPHAKLPGIFERMLMSIRNADALNNLRTSMQDTMVVSMNACNPKEALARQAEVAAAALSSSSATGEKSNAPFSNETPIVLKDKLVVLKRDILRLYFAAEDQEDPAEQRLAARLLMEARVDDMYAAHMRKKERATKAAESLMAGYDLAEELRVARAKRKRWTPDEDALLRWSYSHWETAVPDHNTRAMGFGCRGRNQFAAMMLRLLQEGHIEMDSDGEPRAVLDICTALLDPANVDMKRPRFRWSVIHRSSVKRSADVDLRFMQLQMERALDGPRDPPRDVADTDVAPPDDRMLERLVDGEPDAVEAAREAHARDVLARKEKLERLARTMQRGGERASRNTAVGKGGGVAAAPVAKSGTPARQAGARVTPTDTEPQTASPSDRVNLKTKTGSSGPLFPELREPLRPRLPAMNDVHAEAEAVDSVHAAAEAVGYGRTRRRVYSGIECAKKYSLHTDTQTQAQTHRHTHTHTH